MAKIKITCGGCGIKYKDAHGTERYELRTPEDKPFEVDDAQAARLVGLNVAEYVGEVVKEEAPAQEPEKEGPALDEMDYNALKALAAEMGVIPEGKKKDDYIAAIRAAQAETPELDDEEEGDELPDLSVADPE